MGQSLEPISRRLVQLSPDDDGKATQLILQMQDKNGQLWIVAAAAGRAQPVGGGMPPMALEDLEVLELKLVDLKVIS